MNSKKVAFLGVLKKSANQAGSLPTSSSRKLLGGKNIKEIYANTTDKIGNQ